MKKEERNGGKKGWTDCEEQRGKAEVGGERGWREYSGMRGAGDVKAELPHSDRMIPTPT